MILSQLLEMDHIVVLLDFSAAFDHDTYLRDMSELGVLHYGF